MLSELFCAYSMTNTQCYIIWQLNCCIVRCEHVYHVSPHPTAVHTIAHWYNYESFVAYNPPTSVTEFGLPAGSFVPEESTVVLPEHTVSSYEWTVLCTCMCMCV